MKKILTLLTASVFVLTFGLTFAEAKDMRGNGVTVFDSYLGSSIAAGSLDVGVNNGITVTESAPVEHAASGSAAGGLREEGSGMHLYNGITIFDAGAVTFD